MKGRLSMMTMTDKKRKAQGEKIDRAIQMIDDAVMELIRGGERLSVLEGQIRMELGTIFNKAFRAECEMVQEERRK